MTESHNYQSVSLATLISVCIYSDVLKKAGVASYSQNFLLYYRRFCVGGPAKTCRNRRPFCKPGHVSGTSLRRTLSSVANEWVKSHGGCTAPSGGVNLNAVWGFLERPGQFCLFRAVQIPHLIRQSPDCCSVFTFPYTFSKKKKKIRSNVEVRKARMVKYG